MLRMVLRLLVLLLIVSPVIFAACIDFSNELNISQDIWGGFSKRGCVTIRFSFQLAAFSDKNIFVGSYY